MDTKEYKTEQVIVDKIYKKSGAFKTETGTELKFTNAYIEFRIGDYPLVFVAKVDKATKDYLEKAYEN